MNVQEIGCVCLGWYLSAKDKFSGDQWNLGSVEGEEFLD
jgi:hypothetical protein